MDTRKKMARYAVGCVVLMALVSGCSSESSKAKDALVEIAACCEGTEPRSCQDKNVPMMDRRAQFLGRAHYDGNSVFKDAVDAAMKDMAIDSARQFNFCGSALAKVKANIDG